MSDPHDINMLNDQLKANNASWQAATNPITQLDRAQQDVLLGLRPGPQDMSLDAVDSAIKSTPAITIEQAMAERNAMAPTKFDNRNIGGRNYVTPVKDQGGCGSCVAFGVTAVIEATYQRQTNQPTSGINLSEAHLFYCHGADVGASCSGGWLPDPALKKAKEHGIASEDMFPYVGSQQACQVNTDWKNSSATSTGHDRLGSRSAIKEWIATKGPVTGCFVVYSDFFAYSTGVYRRQSNEQRGGHCVSIVGYDDHLAAWICKNSWGAGWGDNGYFMIGYGECAIETWAGPYGVTGVVLREWAKNTKVSGLYTTKHSNNSWAYLSGHGWRRLATASEATQHAMLAELIAARTADRKVSALIEGKKIKQLYAMV